MKIKYRDDFYEILNLTQHQPTDEQSEAGLTPALAEIANLITFSAQELLEAESIELLFLDRASKILSVIFKNYGLSWEGRPVMLGGMPAFTAFLQNFLKALNFSVLYAVSDRISVEETLEDGSVVKRSVFKHIGFIEM